MQGLTLKYNTLEDWPDYLKANSLSSTCQLVTKNGNTKINTFILAAISPFLGQVLSTLPPFIESCIILPDIEWTEISQFLKSFSKSSEHVMISKSLSQVLGINLNSFIEVSMRNQSNTIENIVDLVHIKEEDNKKRLAVEISTNIQEYQTINPAKKTMINEIDQTQELFYPAIMKAIVATGFNGFTAQEFIPVGSNPLQSLEKAIKLCDV